MGIKFKVIGMASADRQHTTKEETKVKLGVSSGGHSMNVGYETNEQRHATNCDRSARQHVRSQRASDKRKRVTQGATAGFFAGGLVGGGAGAGIGAIIGSVVPGVGTLIGAAVGATIGGIVGGSTVGGTGLAVGAGVAAALPEDKEERVKRDGSPPSHREALYYSHSKRSPKHTFTKGEGTW